MFDPSPFSTEDLSFEVIVIQLSAVPCTSETVSVFSPCQRCASLTSPNLYDGSYDGFAS